jgi:hypothetical protein
VPAAEIEALVMAALRNRLSGVGPLPDESRARHAKWRRGGSISQNSVNMTA